MAEAYCLSCAKTIIVIYQASSFFVWQPLLISICLCQRTHTFKQGLVNISFAVYLIHSSSVLQIRSVPHQKQCLGQLIFLYARIQSSGSNPVAGKYGLGGRHSVENTVLYMLQCSESEMTRRSILERLYCKCLEMVGSWEKTIIQDALQKTSIFTEGKR